MILSIDNRKTVKSYTEKSFSLNFGYPFASRGCLKSLYFSWYLLTRTANINKPNRFCYYVRKGHGFRENLLSVIVSTSLIFMFVDQLLLVDVFSQRYYLTYAIKQQCRTYRYKSLNHEKSIISI